MDDFRDCSRVLNAELYLPPSLMSNYVEQAFLTSISPLAATANVSLRNNKRLVHVNKNKGDRGK